MKRHRIIYIILTAVILLVAVTSSAQTADVPPFIAYQGNLTDAAGMDITATLPVEIRIYDSLIAGIGAGVSDPHVVYAEGHPAVRIEGGVFSINIGDGVPLGSRWTALPTDDLAAKENVYLELWIDGERLSPRQRLGAIPAALKAQQAKYADTLEHVPEITADMMPAYDAAKITAGVFTSAQIPNLSTSQFTSGTLSSSAVPSLSADKFLVGSSRPTIDADYLPSNINAEKITGAPLPLERFPENLLQDEDVVFAAATLRHFEMLVLPDGFEPGECAVWYALGTMPETAEDGLTTVNISLDSDNVLTCTYTPPDRSVIRNCHANYMYVCKKGT